MRAYRQPLIGGIAFLLAILFPIVLPTPEATTIAFFTLIYVTNSSAWNIIGGYAGYISLGHAVFFGIGAYTVAILAQHFSLQGGYGMFGIVVIGGVMGGIFAVPMGFVALRLRSLHSFVIVTIAFLFMFQMLGYNLVGLTNGSSGLGIPQPNWSPQFFNLPFYFAALLLATLTILASWWIRGSRFGLGLLAIRDDEDKAAGVGVDAWRYKFAAYIISAIPVAMAGGLVGYFSSYIYPQTVFDPLVDLSIVLSAFLGGMGTLLGPILGALILQPAQQLLSLYTGAAGWDLILFGVLFLVVILIMPSGIVPTIVERARRRAVRATVISVDETLPGTATDVLGGEKG